MQVKTSHLADVYYLISQNSDLKPELDLSPLEQCIMRVDAKALKTKDLFDLMITTESKQLLDYTVNAAIA